MPANTTMRFVSGRDANLLMPKPADFDIGDVARGLSLIPRFGGQQEADWDDPWSVAQHSLLVTDLISPMANAGVKLLALLHDAHEAFGIGDIITQAKNTICHLNGGDDVVGDMARDLDDAIFQAAGLPMTIPEEWHVLVKAADQRALQIEKHQIRKVEPDDPSVTWHQPLRPSHHSMVRQMFADRFRQLQRDWTQTRLA